MDDVIEIGKGGFKVWCYGKNKKFVCRLEIAAAGMAVFTGTKGGKRVADLSWEHLIEELTRRR
jgi:hypothetical protein